MGFVLHVLRKSIKNGKKNKKMSRIWLEMEIVR